MTVLVVSGPDDPTADAVSAQLRLRGTSAVRTDIGDFPQRMSLAATMDRGCWRGWLRTPETVVELAELGAVYYRRPTRFEFPADMSPPDALLAAAEARHGLGGVLAALDVIWVNDPSLAARAEYKPLQLRVAADVGLAVPPTIVTSDHAAGVAFSRLHGPVVAKPLSSLVLGDESGQPLITYTTRVDPDSVAAPEFETTTNLLQRWVPKVADCRVTVVGHRSFAAMVRAESDAGQVDWRSDYGSLSYQPVEVPAEVAAGLTRYLRSFGLCFAAFDFGLDAEGTWWFYEANPNGEWLWIEMETGLPISAAIAELLAKKRFDD